MHETQLGPKTQLGRILEITTRVIYDEMQLFSEETYIATLKLWEHLGAALLQRTAVVTLLTSVSQYCRQTAITATSPRQLACVIQHFCKDGAVAYPPDIHCCVGT